ncbi:MAG: hypothetical protein R2705_14395 [Ilumatobacteraceae bacterium]
MGLSLHRHVEMLGPQPGQGLVGPVRHLAEHPIQDHRDDPEPLVDLGGCRGVQRDRFVHVADRRCVVAHVQVLAQIDAGERGEIGERASVDRRAPRPRLIHRVRLHDQMRTRHPYPPPVRAEIRRPEPAGRDPKREPSRLRDPRPGADVNGYTMKGGSGGGEGVHPATVSQVGRDRRPGE